MSAAERIAAVEPSSVQWCEREGPGKMAWRNSEDRL